MIRDTYQQRLQQQRLKPDPAQAEVVAAMQQLHEELVRYQASRRAPWLSRLAQLFDNNHLSSSGLYIWGGVGRGKTLLMNLFHETLPTTHKQRLHFHHFMLQVHADLAELQRDSNDRRNPLRKLASRYAQRYQVLCLDEFIVTNITDAMLLYGLLDALFANGVVLVATSNRVPDDLYLNGLQRERFLPAIALIKNRMQVLHLDSAIDHRLELLEQAGLYFCPIEEDTNDKMMREFEALAGGDIEHHGHIRVHGRDIPFIARSDECIWFSFDVICNEPRATPDYIQIAERYRTVFLSDVPQMDEDVDDKARRFIYLIDELYDRRLTLVMSSWTKVEGLYRGDMLAFAFRRTSSRLLEMQSEHYIAQSTSAR